MGFKYSIFLIFTYINVQDISNIRIFKCSDFQMSEFFHYFNSSQISFTAKLKLIFLPHICFVLVFRIKTKQNHLPLPFEYHVIKLWSYLPSLHTTSMFFDKTPKKYDSEVTIPKRFSAFRPVNSSLFSSQRTVYRQRTSRIPLDPFLYAYTERISEC